MRRPLAALLLAFAVGWSALLWFLVANAGQAAPAVVTLTRWLELEPQSTQWLADALAQAGTALRWLLGAVWIIGLAGLAAMARLSTAGTNARP